MKKYFTLIVLAFTASLLVGCGSTQWGVARFPDARTLFITTANEDAFVAKRDLIIPYQPIGPMGLVTTKFQPCGGNLKGTYTSLERAIAGELIDKAKKELGGDAIINYEWSVSSSWQRFLATYSAFAQTGDVYSTAFLTVVAPFAYVLNSNTVMMQGLVVKKK